VNERAARTIAGFAAFGVLLLSMYVIVYPGVRDFSVDDDVYARRAVTDRVVTETPDGRTVELTTKEAGDSTLERAMGDGGMLLLRVGVAFAVAYLTGAVVQRVLLGRYGFRAAGAELEVVANGVSASTDAIEELARLVDEQGAKLADSLRASADALRTSAETARRVEEIDLREHEGADET
jgi:hypothetical protein